MKSLQSSPLIRAEKGWYAWLRYTLVVVFFALVSTLYFLPALLDGRTLYRNDVEAVSGNGSDAKAYNEEHPKDPSYWTNSLFGGMPMYQIAPSYPSTHGLEVMESIYTLRSPINFLGSYPWLLFALMIGFFIFLKSLKIPDLPSILGALLWAFSSYFVILIGAGHLWKLMTLAYIPPTLAGMVLIYRQRYLLGAAILSFFTAIQLLANHVQMTYYFLFVMLAFFIAWLVEAIRKHNLKPFLQATGVAILAGGVGIAINSTNLYHTYSYSQETMRGGSELTLSLPTADKSTNEEHAVNSKGLEKEYITQWSYGIGETWSLMLPNVRGGASEPLTKQVSHLQKASPEVQGYLSNFSAYWGEQPFTSGPVYVGIFVIMLFLLGAMIVKGPLKWALLGGTLFSILLSWGKNFMPLTDFFIDYIPLYDKFRSVSSILVIAEFTIPTLAVLGLVELIKDPNVLKRRKIVPIVAFGLPLLVLFTVALFPSVMGSFMSKNEISYLSTMASTQSSFIEVLEYNLALVRKSMLVSDAWRGILFAILSLGALLLFLRKRIKTPLFVVLVGVISLVDLWGVCKRYLSDDMFQKNAAALVAQPSPADLEILKDKEPTYRVFNLTVDPFNDASTSRWHRSVGGYHAAKLQRYQDLIDYQLKTHNLEVLNMLNTRYFIVPDPSSHQPIAQFNPEAFGSAWFVNKVEIVDNANEEMAALSKGSLRYRAIVDKRFATPELRELTPLTDSTATLSLERFSPKEMLYQVKLQQPALALFSQIYYPHGWHAEVEGPENSVLPIIRANYVLRGIVLPQGNYKVRIFFDPSSIHITEAIATSAFVVLLLLLLSSLLLPLYRTWKKTSSSSSPTLQ